MAEIHYCPFCDAPAHKVVAINEDMHFCKMCNKFFNIEFLQLQCPKCQSKRYGDSDFLAPDGQVVIQCSSCKKMYSLREFVEKNKMKSTLLKDE